MLAAPGSRADLGCLGDGYPMAQVSGHIRCGACCALNEVAAVKMFRDRLFRNLWTVSGGMPADCLMSRVSGLDRRVFQQCREAGGWCPTAWGLTVLFTRSSELPGATVRRRGSRLSRAAWLRSWVTIVLDTPDDQG